MSAVVEFVSDVVEDVVEAVGDAVETVVETVETTIKAVAENPEILIIAVVAPQILPAIGVPAIAVQPVTAALISASQGGDIEDIGKAALTAYVAPQVAGRVGGAVAAATEGSALQNSLASAAGSAAGAATGAAITGGDIGAAALTGAAAGAGASIGREIAAATEYGTTPFSQQTQDIISQEANVNRFSGLAADIGSAVGRGLVTGDVNLESAFSAAATRELGDQLRDAFASSPGSQETQKATQIIAAEMDTNPGFQEQLQLAQIANGDVALSVDQQIDALAEALARDTFDAAATGEQVAALPAVALPIAVNAAAQAAVRAAPNLTQQIARFAANDPRFAQVMVTNPYVQQLLAAAGLTISVSLTGDTTVNPIIRQNESPAEAARLARYAAETQKSLPKTNTQQVTRLENTARQYDLQTQKQDLEDLSRQGFNVDQQLQRIETQIEAIPTVDVTQPIGDFPMGEPVVEPGTLPPSRAPVIEPYTTPGIRPTRTPSRTPSTRPEEETAPRPGTAPETAPETAPTTSPETAPETAPVTQPRTQTDRVPDRTTPPRTPTTPRTPTGADGTPTGPDVGVEEEPVNIDDLFTDEDILEFIREGLGEDFVAETPTDVDEVTTGGTEGTTPPTIDIRGGGGATTPSPYRTSVSSRAVGTGPGAVTGRKEPMFGGDPGAQSDAWNVRSLRLKKALGL
jgi:ribosomal protein L9